jgi:DNA-directed RNA polymerase subunit RPC12/RpoP
MYKILIPPTEKKWLRCPYCGAKTIIYDNSAECRGVHIKCTRGCKREFEVIIENGKPVVQ